jgi:microcystin-dependent protein
MAQPFIGEIRMFGGNFAPAGWAFCDGAMLNIADNDPLFTLIGTTYGGDGQTTFALPNLQSRFPVHQGTNAGQTFIIGETGGTEQETLTVQQIPVHNHVPTGNDAGGSDSPATSVWGKSTTGKPYATPAGPTVTFDPQTVSPVGGSQPHENMQPFLCVSFIISLFGFFPTQ